MNIINILEGIEKLVVELLLWILFIPKTLFKIITDPNWVPIYIKEELDKKSERFDDYISPVLLFLTSSVVLFTIADNIPSPDKILADLQGSKGLLVGLGFLSLPLLFSLATEIFRPTKFTRKNMLRIFYIQCFYFSPLTLSFFAGALLFPLLPEEELVITLSTFILLISIFMLFLIAEVKLIARELQIGKWKATSVFLGITLVSIVAGFYVLISFTSGSEIDAYYAGDSEEIPELSLPSSGEFSISTSGYDDSVGNYQLSLINKASGGGDPECQSQQGEAFPTTGTLVYDQCVTSRVPQGVASVWTFNGTEKDIINITVDPNIELDAILDVLDDSGESILSTDTTNHPFYIGYMYILLTGLAVILGFRSLFRKPKKPSSRKKGLRKLSEI